MKTIVKCTALLLAWCGLSTAGAVPNAVVDVVQAPAWVERAAQRRPLAPGMVLENRDRLLTGEGGRIAVRLADGSALQLGEGGAAQLNALQQTSEGVFNAALDVARGGFRLTTDRFRRPADRRVINVRVGALTVSVRRGDVWGRAGVTQDIVSVLDGRVVATHPQAEVIALDVPGQVLVADRGDAPAPVSMVSAGVLANWVAETGLSVVAGPVQQRGRWGLDFGRFDQSTVLALYDRLQAAGYAVRIRPVREAAGYRYALRLAYLPSEGDARQVAERLQQHLHVPQAVVVAPAAGR